ncbi:hypothetical protein, partial [Streptomyces sp. WM6386]|uniref:hypothetical protein n=1 Tax=Streptomyces sp. WM6386 TaxID=1415558 RepID=UPI0006199E8B
MTNYRYEGHGGRCPFPLGKGQEQDHLGAVLRGIAGQAGRLCGGQQVCGGQLTEAFCRLLVQILQALLV